MKAEESNEKLQQKNNNCSIRLSEQNMQQVDGAEKWPNLNSRKKMDWKRKEQNSRDPWNGLR